MSFPDYYQLLGLESSASEAEIKRAYRKMALRFHPDGGSKEANEQLFMEATEAYGVLCNAERRKEYDKSYVRNSPRGQKVAAYQKAQATRPNDFRNEFNSRPVQSSVRPTPKASSRPSADKKTSLFSKSSKFLKYLKSRLKTFIADRQKAPALESMGSEAFHTVKLNALESLEETRHNIEIPGFPNSRTASLIIPANVKDGEFFQVILKPTGEKTKVQVRIFDHPLLSRKGCDLHLKVPLTISEAFKGIELELPCFGGKVRVKIPPIGELKGPLRVKGKGIIRPERTGDLIVLPFLEAPDSTSEMAIHAAQSLDALYSREVRASLPKSLGGSRSKGK